MNDAADNFFIKRRHRPRPPGPRLNEAARLPQPKSIFPSPTVGLATEEYTHVDVLRFAQEHQG
jgi:hypothetical protein